MILKQQHLLFLSSSSHFESSSPKFLFGTKTETSEKYGRFDDLRFKAKKSMNQTYNILMIINQGYTHTSTSTNEKLFPINKKCQNHAYRSYNVLKTNKQYDKKGVQTNDVKTLFP